MVVGVWNQFSLCLPLKFTLLEIQEAKRDGRDSLISSHVFFFFVCGEGTTCCVFLGYSVHFPFVLSFKGVRFSYFFHDR